MNVDNLEHITVREINVYAENDSKIEDALPEATGFAMKHNIRVILHHNGSSYPIVPDNILESIYRTGSDQPQQPQPSPQQPSDNNSAKLVPNPVKTDNNEDA